jgi:hypothetical protein
VLRLERMMRRLQLWLGLLLVLRLRLRPGH